MRLEQKESKLNSRLDFNRNRFSSHSKSNKKGLEKKNLIHCPILDEERGQIVCSKCGVVLEDKVLYTSHGARAYGQEERNNKTHHGVPINPLLPDIQMATIVKKENARSGVLRHALRWDTRYTWRQRNLIRAISEIRRLGMMLALPSYIQESSADLYKRLYKRNLLKGRSIKGMVTAVIYYLTSKENVFRPIDKISKHSGVPQRIIHNCYQVILENFRFQSPVIQPKYLVSRPICDLKLPSRVELKTHHVLRLYEKVYTFSGLDPKGIVAAALYYSAKDQCCHATQAKIAKIMGVTEITLRKRLLDIKNMIDFIKKYRKEKHRKSKNGNSNVTYPELPSRFRERKG